jgi:hypothetical protein
VKLVVDGRRNPAPVTTLTADGHDADRAFLEKTTKVVARRAA